MTWPSSEPPRDEPASGTNPTPPPTPANVPPYGQPYQAYGPPGPGAVRRTNGLAVAALVCAIAGTVTGIAAPVGAVLGHVASRQIAQTGEEGAPLAKAAIWVGWILTGLYVAGCCAGLSLLIAANRAQ